ncbi:MAG: tRNA lysidine(34) synthetase TilS [Pseudobdellovibrionaceae bacterium]
MTPKPISDTDFAAMMESLALPPSLLESGVALAVSGGGDSMALSFLLETWCRVHGIPLTGLTVDHGLRPEAAREAEFVHQNFEKRGLTHCILKWEGIKPKSSLQEEARAARYHLMQNYCATHGIVALFTAHHGEDQIETVIFRLCKGSGLDGLVGMRPVQELGGGVNIIRPLLSVTHQDLIATCEENESSWIEDPSNQNDHYARVRMRAILGTLSEEGLTPARMAHVSRKLERAAKTLNQLTDDYYKNIVEGDKMSGLNVSRMALLALPDEIGLRLLTRMIGEVSTKKDYPARSEDIERLYARLKNNQNFKGATLGGCLFKLKKDILMVEKEER